MPLLKRPSTVTKWYTRAEFARRCGVTKEAIYRAIQEKRIRVHKHNNSIMIDWNEEGAKYIASCQKPLRDLGAAVAKRIQGSSSDKREGENVSEYIRNANSITKSKERNEFFKAKKAELDFKERSGELVDTKKVNTAWITIGTMIKKGVSSIPDRVAPLVAAETDEHAVYQILENECLTILEDLANDIERRETEDALFQSGESYTSPEEDVNSGME